MSCISITIGIYVIQRKTSCPRRQQILLYKLGVAITCQDKAAFIRTRHTKKEERNSDLTCRILKLFRVDSLPAWLCVRSLCDKMPHVVSSAVAVLGKLCPPVLEGRSVQHTSAAAAAPWLPKLPGTPLVPCSGDTSKTSIKTLVQTFFPKCYQFWRKKRSGYLQGGE